ncbi:DUF2278 family protein, partial [Clostridium sp. DJ247]|uniref:DUF2278 family protein n=1 Tax=Clostridium sp. DJ247 TaxID=2726188 RepID=UPI00162A8A74
MGIPIYVVCKAKGSTITNIGCEIPKKEGKQITASNIYCRYEKIGGIFHYYFKVKSETVYIGDHQFQFDNRNIEVQINVRSHHGRKTPKLEYVFKENFQIRDESKFSFEELKKLDYGIKVLNFEKENINRRISIDYVRSNLFDINEFREVPTTADLNEELHRYITKTIEQDADVYIYGDLFPLECTENDDRAERINLLKKNGPKGIHDIHMNQGNSEKK